MHKLNDECLMHIFTYIPRGEHLKLEKVCRRWRTISRQSWRTFKKFDFAKKTWGDNKTFLYTNILMLFTLEDVLYRCGSFLTHIDFSQRFEIWQELSWQEVSVFAKYCRNLQYIDMSNTDLEVITHEPLYEKELSKLFLNNQKLRYVRFVNTTIIGECLLNLPADSLETLIITKSFNISPRHFDKALKKFQKLNILSLNECKMQLDNYNGPLVGNIRTSFNEEFRNLKILNFYQNDCINNRVIKIIGVVCRQLRHVNVAHCYKIRNKGLAHIVSLPKLQHLDISYLPKVTDEILTDMPNLRTLKCISCKKVKSQGLCQLIKKSLNLKLLDVTECEKVNDELLNVAIETTNNRTNNIMLKMYALGTNITIWSMTTPFFKFRRTLGQQRTKSLYT